MSKIINLRRARKNKERAEAERDAEANRVKHGRAKAEKQHASAIEKLAERRLDGHKRNGDDSGSDD